MSVEKPFFVGFLPVPARLRLFLIGTCLILLALFGATGYVIATTQADPGPGAFRFDYGRQEVTGILTSDPYPVMHVTQGSERIPAGHSIILSGGGKNGTQDRTDPLDGQMATIRGVLLERGDLDMLQMNGRPDAMDAGGPASLPEPVDLGRWRIAGEICDGKCLAGAMRPGTGLAHRACANLCLSGGVPPVFAASQPVEGYEFMLIGGPDGGPITGALLDYTALYISVEGRLELRGDLPVFLMDPDSIHLVE